jgi:hypothetical protein
VVEAPAAVAAVAAVTRFVGTGPRPGACLSR